MISNLNAVLIATVVAGMVGNALVRYAGAENLIYAISILVVCMSVLLFLMRPRMQPGSRAVIVFVCAGIMPFMITVSNLNWPVAIAGLAGLYAYCVMWALWLTSRPPAENETVFEWYSMLHVWLGVTTALLAFCQSYVSSDLFGIMPVRPYTALDLIDLGFTRRATGFIGSPQNLGAYMGIVCVCTAAAVRCRWRRTSLWTLFLLAGMLSGSAAFVLFVSLALAAYIWCLRTARLRMVAVGLLVALAVVMIVRVQSVSELENTRFGALYIGQLEDRRPYSSGLISYEPFGFLVGHGLGTANRVTEVMVGEQNLPDVWRGSESYFATLFYETGMLGFLGFVYLYLRAVGKCFRGHTRLAQVALAILVGLAGNLLVTPSFTGLTLAAIAWPFILIPLLAPQSLESSEKLSVRTWRTHQWRARVGPFGDPRQVFQPPLPRR